MTTVKVTVQASQSVTVYRKGDKGDAGTNGTNGAAGTNGSDATVTKSNVEAVLTGNITSHTHSELLGIACSDVATDLTTGEKIAFDMPFSCVITRVYGSLTAPATGNALTVDIEDEGTSILNAVLSIANGANNGETSVFAAAAVNYAFTKGDLISIDIDQVGSTAAGKGLIIFLEGYRT